jgi:hypothetical protein
MTPQIHFLINSGLCWSIVLMAVAGYLLTLKRIGQKWPFWMIIIIGWAFLAISNSLAALGVNPGTSYVRAVWLASFVLVIASLTLLFIKLIEIIHARGNGTTKGVVKGKES